MDRMSAQSASEKRGYHIHAEVSGGEERRMGEKGHLPEDFVREARALGFIEGGFCGDPEGTTGYGPSHFLTFKTTNGEIFKTVWGEVTKLAYATGMRGYHEGEYVREEWIIPEKKYLDVPVPFRIATRHLAGLPDEGFRQTELHLTMHKDVSDQRLVKKLFDAGLYGSYLTKKDGIYLVLTMQGFIKDIGPLIVSLHQYLLEAGGASRCSLKEERAIRYTLFGISEQDLPKIAASVVYL